ncbi:MAG: hypothetical protein KKA73_00805 [Chloroflexi bacterium]|nr:hypothetical protein [Chloroflexota bacterium]
MAVDYTAQVLGGVETLLEQLANQERLADARKVKDRLARKQAEDKANSLRSQLLRQVDASLIYLYLAASGTASDVGFRSAWQIGALRVDTLAPLKQWGLESLYNDFWTSRAPDLSVLPAHSFSLCFTFTLSHPYLSKDDNVFYIVDNPIVRDKVFHLPIVRPSSWKGSLRTVLYRLGHGKDDVLVQRLFGVARDEDEGQAGRGRLVFFPTFFTQTSLEIINPHDRKTKTGKNPILFECVPSGTTGQFTLLYVPFDLIGADPAVVRPQVGADLETVAQAVRDLFTVYGFGAKTSSGYGVSELELVGAGEMTVRVEVTVVTEAGSASRPPAPSVSAEPPTGCLEFMVDSVFPDHSKSQINQWVEAGQWSKNHRSKYKHAREAYQHWLDARKAEERPVAPPAPRWLEETFTSFAGLMETGKRMRQKLEALP